MKTILLSKGKCALLDDEDYEVASSFRWHLLESKTANFVRFYATTKIEGKTTYLHRFVLSAPAGMQVDHRDHDGLNNQRSNLRLCTQRQNNGNLRRTPNTSGFRGVFFYPPRGTWQAKISKYGKNRSLGYRKTPEEAARLYDAAAREHFGEFTMLNFPDDSIDPGSADQKEA